MGNAERREPTIAQILNESKSKRYRAELHGSAFLLVYGSCAKIQKRLM